MTKTVRHLHTANEVQMHLVDCPCKSVRKASARLVCQPQACKGSPVEGVGSRKIKA